MGMSTTCGRKFKQKVLPVHNNVNEIWSSVHMRLTTKPHKILKAIKIKFKQIKIIMFDNSYFFVWKNQKLYPTYLNDRHRPVPIKKRERELEEDDTTLNVQYKKNKPIYI